MRPKMGAPDSLEVTVNRGDPPVIYVRADLVWWFFATRGDAIAGRADWENYHRALAALKEASR